MYENNYMAHEFLRDVKVFRLMPMVSCPLMSQDSLHF